MTAGPVQTKKPSGLSVIAVTGMKAEAKLARGPGILVLTSCGDSQTLSVKLNAAIKKHAAGTDGKKPLGIISFGIAGGLAPHLSPGAKLIARRVAGPDGQFYSADAKWSAYLAAVLPQSESAELAGVELPVITQKEKAALYRRTGAFAVDMESHVAAKLAQEHGLPFTALRVIADSADQALPHAAQAGLKPDGGIAFMAIAKSVLRHPAQLPALWRLGRNTKIAFASLLSSRQAAGEGFGFLDLG